MYRSLKKIHLEKEKFAQKPEENFSSNIASFVRQHPVRIIILKLLLASRWHQTIDIIQQLFSLIHLLQHSG